MATIYKVLGQSAPAATTDTDIYTVPAGNSAVVSTLAICNRGVSATYRVAVRPAGATLANTHYLVYDNALNQYDSIFLTLGITMAATDVLTVYSSTAGLTFSAFGSEIS
jgi:hypothetical protein